MKFKVYDQTNSKNFVVGKATLRVNEKTGLFTFSKEATNLIGIKSMDRICILQDEASPEDFFIHKNQGVDSIILRTKDEKSISFNSTLLATLILDKGATIKHTVKLNRSASFTVGQPQEVDGLILHLIILSKPFIAK